jgi:hypothetical protein
MGMQLGLQAATDGAMGSSGGGPYSPFTAAILALDRIDFAPRLHRLRYLRKSGAIACRAYMLGRFHGRLSHFNLSGSPLVGGLNMPLTESRSDCRADIAVCLKRAVNRHGPSSTARKQAM